MASNQHYWLNMIFGFHRFTVLSLIQQHSHHRQQHQQHSRLYVHCQSLCLCTIRSVHSHTINVFYVIWMWTTGVRKTREIYIERHRERCGMVWGRKRFGILCINVSDRNIYVHTHSLCTLVVYIIENVLYFMYTCSHTQCFYIKYITFGFISISV